MATFIPMAAGAVLQGVSAQNAANYNSWALTAQANALNAEGAQREAQQRRDAREFLGRQSAAMGESGAGYGGSNALSLEQSSVNAELDALNIRYGTQMKSMGLLMDAAEQKRQGSAAMLGGLLGAGGQILLGLAERKRQNDLLPPKSASGLSS